MRKVFILSVVFRLVVLLTYAPSAGAADIHVPGDYSTIQAAINAASSGDVVIVHSGIYCENINFNGKVMSVKSSNPDDPAVVAATIIDGGQRGSVVTFNQGEGIDSVLIGFTVQNGKADYGGGIYCSSSPRIENCIIKGNLATYYGGGISCWNFSSPNINNCIISENSGDFGGGGIGCWCSSSPSINNCVMSKNLAGYGGGVYCTEFSSPNINNCIISENSGDFGGGGIGCWYSSSPSINNCTISENSTGIDSWYFSSPNIINCIISRNLHGGIYCTDSLTRIVNCTISKNSGSGIYCENSSPCVVNSILWGNEWPEIYTIEYSNPRLSYCDIQGGYPGLGNISIDPLFVDLDHDDFHLQNGSPCINTGTSDSAPSTDIEGHLRPSGLGYDIGAYEYRDIAWPCFMHDSRHTGRSIYLGPKTNNLKWRSDYDYFQSSPAIGADGTIYLGGRWTHSVYAFNPDGSLKWAYLTGNGVVSSPAISADNTIYIGSHDSYLYALNPDGNLKWKYQTGGAIWSSPVIDADGTVYIGGTDSYLYALNPDGSLKWKYQTEYEIGESSPAISIDGTIYIGNNHGYLYALNQDGSLKWKYQTGLSHLHSSPAISADGTIYFGSDDSYLYALNPDGKLKWIYGTSGEIFSSPAIDADGTVYIGSHDGYLYALNPDGSLKWKYQTGGAVSSSPAIDADGIIYFGSDDSYLYALNSDGNLKWKYQTTKRISNSSPAIGACGTVYIGSSGGIFAFGPEFTLIELDQFNAVPQDDKITLTWNTLSEIDNAGFNLLRSESENGTYTKINFKIIEAEGGATSKAEYFFTDDTAKPGVKYYYKLEDLDIRGVSTFHGLISATIPAPQLTYVPYWLKWYSPWPPIYGRNYSLWRSYYPYP